MTLTDPDEHPTDQFEINPSPSPDGSVWLRVRGELDMASVEGFEPALERAMAATDGPVVVDFAECGFVDSIGVRALIRGARGLANSGRVMRIVGAHDQVRELFGMIALDQATAIEFADEDAEG
jgi:anti-anti-sigma factor